ncbi:hypothetical protein ACH50O_03150 [Methylomonas sp. 2BW1-5-20]|uniref:hypothetical protein n=1 Tax=Methylomonas sp. 2BW1-5-20 TaxID=3376686 RepID=UPI00404FACAB
MFRVFTGVPYSDPKLNKKSYKRRDGKIPIPRLRNKLPISIEQQLEKRIETGDRQKLRDRLCLRRPDSSASPRFAPTRGSKHWLSHDLTPCRDALQVFSASLRKPARRYGYRGLKIFTSLALRFQDLLERSKQQMVKEMEFKAVKTMATT